MRKLKIKTSDGFLQFSKSSRKLMVGDRPLKNGDTVMVWIKQPECVIPFETSVFLGLDKRYWFPELQAPAAQFVGCFIKFID